MLSAQLCFMCFTETGQGVTLTIPEMFFLFTFGFDLNWMQNKTFLNFPGMKCSPSLWVHVKFDAFMSF